MTRQLTPGPIPKGIALHGAVNSAGRPFVITYIDQEPYGQLTPAEAIAHGTRAIQAAIEAERDAALVLACLEAAAAEGVTAEEGQTRAVVLLEMIRRHRGQVDPDPGQSVAPSARPRTEQP